MLREASGRAALRCHDGGSSDAARRHRRRPLRERRLDQHAGAPARGGEVEDEPERLLPFDDAVKAAQEPPGLRAGGAGRCRMDDHDGPCAVVDLERTTAFVRSSPCIASASTSEGRLT